MVKPTLDLMGQRFGRLTVVERLGKVPKRGQMWLCRCDCGGTKIKRASALRIGEARSCGCLLRESRSLNGKRLKRALLDGRSLALNRLRSSHLGAARDRGIAPLDRATWEAMVLSPCSYCGSRDQRDVRSRQGLTIAVVGIDRIDNSKGYEPDNCVPCCKVCNLAKNTMTRDEFIAWVERVHAHLVGAG